MERFGEILFQNGKCDDNNQSTIFSDECKVCVPSSAQYNASTESCKFT